MAKEKNLGTVTTLSNSDFFRVVTELGLSKKVTGEILKAFIGASTITKVNDYYYFQDAANPQENDYRFFVDTIFLRTQRYQSAVWTDVVIDGGSTTITRVLEILEEVGADIYVNDNGEIRNLIRSATFSNGTVVGDIFGDVFLATDDEIYKVRRETPESWKVINSGTSFNTTGTMFYGDVTTADNDGFVSSRVKIQGVNLPSDVKIQLKIYLQNDLINPIWENVTDKEFGIGLGGILDAVTGEFDIKPNFYAIGNQDVRVVFNSSEEITLKGGNDLATDIYFESFDSEVSFKSMITEAPIDGQEYVRKDGEWEITNNVNSAAGYFVGPVLTNCITPTVWYKVDAAYTPQEAINFTFDGVNNRWVYNGPGTSVSIFASFTGGHQDNENAYVYWEFRVNGLQLINPPKKAKIEIGDPQSITMLVPTLSLVTGDYIELFTKISNTTEYVTTENMNLLIR